MSLWSRFRNVFRGDGLSREIDEELESHIAEAIEHGREPGGGAAGVRFRAAQSRSRAATSVWSRGSIRCAPTRCSAGGS